MRFEKNDKRSPPKPKPVIYVKEEAIETNNIKVDVKPLVNKSCKHHHGKPENGMFQPASNFFYCLKKLSFRSNFFLLSSLIKELRIFMILKTVNMITRV